MPLWAKQFFALANASFLDTCRQTVVLLITASGLALAGLLPFLVLFQIGEPGRMMRDGALACHLLFGAAAVCVAAANALHSDIEGGTAALVLTKPVGRGLYFVSRFAGVAAAAWLISWLFFATTALSYRASLIPYNPDPLIASAAPAALCFGFAAAGVVNRQWRRSFAASTLLLTALFLLAAFVAVAAFERDAAHSLRQTAVRIAPASLLLGAALTVYAAVMFAAMARGRPPFAFAFCAALFAAGLVSDYYFGAAAAESVWAALLHAVIPNVRRLWVADMLVRGGAVPWRYTTEAFLYGAGMAAAFLSAGLILFRKSELK